MKKWFVCLLAALMLCSMVWCVSAQEDEIPEADIEDVGVIWEEFDIPEDDSLLMSYLENMWEEDPEPESVDYCGKNLHGNDLLTYNKLKKVVLDVAAGRQTSTIAYLTMTEAKLEGVRFSAADLGVSKVYENGQYDQNAISAISKKVHFMNSAVRYAVWMDTPSELFWRNRQVQYDYSQCKIKAVWDNGEYKLYLTGTVGLCMGVRPEFAGSETYCVNPSKIRQVNYALDNARYIVQKYLGVPDLQKLEGYRDELCALNAYDHESADKGSKVMGYYAWEIINMFDGDPTTNVVCEGYAKSFQYLCNMTAFDGDIYAYSIVGNEGGHMWNIVHMDDGRNYHTDITWVDSDQGQHNYWFLRPVVEGSPDWGYVVATPYGQSTFTFDAANLQIYTREQLTLSRTEYQVPTQGTLARRSDGIGWYERGVFQSHKYGFVYYNGGKFLVAHGLVQTDKNGLAQDPEHPDNWFFLSGGQVQLQYTGLVQYDGQWFYVENGRLDTTMSALVEYDGGLFYVADGRIVREKDGLGQDPATGKWYFFSGGQVQKQYTGLAKYDGQWFYVKNGEFQKDYNGYVYYNGGRFQIKNGTMIKQV